MSWVGGDEYQSSSGVIVFTGTGATRWARSINCDRSGFVTLPAPEERKLAYFVREALPGGGYATDTTFGSLAEGNTLHLTSDMNVGEVVGDGIQSDQVAFGWGARADIAVSPQVLLLAV